jgi:hypothetical protein
MPVSEWITTAEAVRISGYSGYHLRELLNTGRVKARKFGTVWQVNRSSLVAYTKAAQNTGKKRGPKKAA